MLKYLIYFSLLTYTGHSIKAQNIFTDTELKRGRYKDFNEFIHNNPSLPFDRESIDLDYEISFLLGELSSWYDLEGILLRLPVYKLFDKKSGKRLNTKDEWGFCDGKKVYINSFTHIPQRFYVELLIIGRYCYFIQQGEGSTLAPTMHKDRPKDTFFKKLIYYKLDQYIININNGKIFKLTNDILETILKSDPELHAEFLKNNEEKGNDLSAYIKKYNDLHKDEIAILK